MTRLAAEHRSVAMDLGTGDGRFVLDRAAAQPEELVIGVDASAAAMAESSRRASRSGSRNAVFVASDVAALPPELGGLADLLTIHFPWGSLLRAAVAADASLVRLLRPGGTLRLLVSAASRDATGGLERLEPDAVAAAYRG
ncbi:MAG: class I SAM-dependent methyltransferase, partial [Candidatus Limnocylindria bacterium]